MSFMNPFVISFFTVKSAHLQTPQLQSEPGAHLVQPDLFTGDLAVDFFKLVPVHSEKYEVSLVVECDHLPASELRIPWV